MVNIRRVHIDELSMAAELANQVFCETGEPYMGTAFPTLFRPGITHSYGAFDDTGRLVSFMGLVPVSIASGSEKISAFSIGAVCTHPHYRGQRLAGQLLERCRQHAIDAGASVIFISGDRSLYTRVGSQFFGRIHQFELTREHAHIEPSGLWELRELELRDLFAVYAYLQHPTAHVEMSISEMQQMLGAEAMAHVNQQQQKVLVAATSNGIAGVAIVSVPHSSQDDQHPSEQDTTSRTGSIIECAGRPDAVGELWLEAIRRFELSSLTVTVPWQDEPMLAVAQATGASSTTIRNGGTVMIVNGGALVAQTGLLGDTNDWAPVHMTIDHEDGSYTVHTPTDEYKLTNDAELCSLLFDPESNLPAAQDAAFTAVPLPYMYGLYFI
ncbi:GNAT family N-acetyltransferase [Paenibacillus hunanensis]|uniref:GNAT family N-acetyltransferase n=1 Tax=Paenibacillus hunanensis TaxID=539262 RepID=UPI002A69ABE7|nr:GNAT family N-acetyltransferase [Paenibacillus hunanensis]WPP40524.1 GNAT family N-acetyltransferase [Paenibacillus hunanensis]